MSDYGNGSMEPYRGRPQGYGQPQYDQAPGYPQQPGYEYESAAGYPQSQYGQPQGGGYGPGQLPPPQAESPKPPKFHSEQVKHNGVLWTVDVPEGRTLKKEHGAIYKMGSFALRYGTVGLLCTTLGTYAGARMFDPLAHLIEKYTPVSVPVPENSSASGKRMTLNPEFKVTYASTKYDVTGTEARTKFTVADTISFSGYGAIFMAQKDPNEKNPDGSPKMLPGGIAEKEYKVFGKDMKIGEVNINGKEITNFVVPIDKVHAEAHFVENQTRLVQSDPPETKIIGGTVDIFSGGAGGSCRIAQKVLRFDKSGCDKVDAVTNWKSQGQAAMQSGTRQATLDFVEKECTDEGWPTADRYAVVDGIVQEAISRGHSPEDVIVSFVDEDGNLTDRAPKHQKTEWETNFPGGAADFGKSLPGTPEISFTGLQCADTVEPYQPKYPDQLNK